jgi:hypothetical protein
MGKHKSISPMLESAAMFFGGYQLTMLLACPLQFYARYILKIFSATETTALVLGRDTATEIENMVRDCKSWGELDTACRDSKIPEVRAFSAELRGLLSNRLFEGADLYGGGLTIEPEVEFQFSKKVQVSNKWVTNNCRPRPDLVITTPSGKKYAIDVKTGRTHWGSEKIKQSPQMLLYGSLCEPTVFVMQLSKELTNSYTFTKEDIKQFWNEVGYRLSNVAVMEKTQKIDVCVTQDAKICKYCPLIKCPARKKS